MTLIDSDGTVVFIGTDNGLIRAGQSLVSDALAIDFEGTGLVVPKVIGAKAPWANKDDLSKTN